MEQLYFQTSQRHAYQEMRQKPASRDTFFSMKSDLPIQRPASVATEIVDTDWDEEDIYSEPEDNSPRISLQSSGQPSFTTVSSYDEVPTPRTSTLRDAYTDHSLKQVQGPRGPHLFRGSTDQLLDESDVILTLSPITPKAPRCIDDLLVQTQPHQRSTPFQYTRQELDTTQLASWTPEMVAQSMLNAGIELSIAERFIENDINGPIVITLKFEDLRELDISSFGIRTRVWHQIQALRDSRPASPRPATPIEDTPSREAQRETKIKEDVTSRGRQGSRLRQRRQPSDTDITPMESVSIIGIEQVIPAPHHCSKGENCSKWRKQQRLMEDFQKANPHIDMSAAGGTVMILGDAGNPETAKAIDPNETLRPFSDAVTSVVASSDVLGPGGMPPLQYLQETALRNLQARDPQDNVLHFLNFQHQQGKDAAFEVPPTPPFEIAPATQPPHQGLRRLPKLSIPGDAIPQRRAPPRASTVPQPQTQQRQQPQRRLSEQSQNFVPYRMDKSCPLSPDLETPRNPCRFGTPFSEMDVPVTAVPLGPVARDASQSVPPDMNYRVPSISSQTPPRSQSRASARRPSFPVLPALDEDAPVRAMSKTPSPKEPSPRASVRPQKPLQPPPRFNYPWSPAERTKFEQAIPPMSSLRSGSVSPPSSTDKGVTYQGPMKKRKVRLLRNEWQDGYFTLKGTRLNMHKDARDIDRTLEYVDIDDYAIACSSLASTSKLSAALKAVHISQNREKSDSIAAFSFQLIPQDKNGARLRKRDSAMHTQGGNPAEGVNGTGKTHHFAVKNRDDRIDWMREMMLAKAMKQKGDGFEISVNGNMI